MMLLLSLPPDSISAAGCRPRLRWAQHQAVLRCTRPRCCPSAALQSTEARITTAKPLLLQLASSGQPTSMAPSMWAMCDEVGEWSSCMCSDFDKPCYLALFKTWQSQHINLIFLMCSIISESFFLCQCSWTAWQLVIILTIGTCKINYYWISRIKVLYSPLLPDSNACMPEVVY